MKRTRIVPTSSPVTTVVVQGRPHHYFRSKALGNCRAILISENENQEHQSHRQLVDEAIEEMEQEEAARAKKPLSKGDKLAILMDCGERLHKRYWAFYAVYDALPENDRKARNAIFAKMEAVNRASNRVTRKISLLLEI